MNGRLMYQAPWHDICTGGYKIRKKNKRLISFARFTNENPIFQTDLSKFHYKS